MDFCLNGGLYFGISSNSGFRIIRGRLKRYDFSFSTKLCLETFVCVFFLIVIKNIISGWGWQSSYPNSSVGIWQYSVFNNAEAKFLFNTNHGSQSSFFQFITSVEYTSYGCEDTSSTNLHHFNEQSLSNSTNYGRDATSQFHYQLSNSPTNAGTDSRRDAGRTSFHFIS